jgi:hypothetical protein
MRLKNTLLKLSLTPVLVLALLAGACSDQGAPTDRLVGPEQAAFSRGGARKLHQLSLANAAPLHATAELGASGGLLQAGDYYLLVPGGAVRARTTFTMDVGTDGVVSLSAIQTRGNAPARDIGADGFSKKLTLALYYGSAVEAIEHESHLAVVQVQSNGVLSPVPSKVDADLKLVYGELSHFSQYAIANPED